MGMHEVMRLLDGRISYRQLDYWIRSGWVTLADVKRPGSGRHRQFTPIEVAALVDFVALYEQLRVVSTCVSDGTAFAQLLDKHRPHLVREVTA